MNKIFSALTLWAAAGLLAPMAAQAQGAAKADFVSGPVMTVGADGVQRALPKGGEVRSGETVVTGEGRAQLNFTDGSIVSLQPKTEFRVDAYKFVEAEPGSEKGFFSLLKGALRTITGKIGRAQKSAYRMSTVVATIGIRGTEYSARLDNGLTASTIAGEIEVCNNGGCTIVRKGQSVFAADANAKPDYTNIQAGLPPAGPPADPNLFIGGERTSPTGGIPIPTLPSGPGYDVLFAGFDTGLAFSLPPGNGTATFDQTGALSGLTGATSGTAATQVEAMTDGVVAWGRWAGGSIDVGAGATPVTNVHYVTGTPTPGAALATLQGIDFQGLGAGKAVYSFMGATQPTAANGAIGGGVSGALTVQFTPATATISTLLTVPISGGYYTITNSGMTGFPSFSDVGASMTCSGSCAGAGATAQINGSFFGNAAQRAGLTYNFTGAGALGGVTGAATFAR